jgi:DNA-binding response OmpR family regulator
MNQILVVDDEPAITHFLTRGLTDKGFAVTVVSCGEQALRAIEQGSPDLVLLDSGLPDLDGYEVCRRVRAQGYTNLPVVMLTAKGKVAETITGLESGADDCIAKPFTFEELLARIRAALRRQEPLSAIPFPAVGHLYEEHFGDWVFHLHFTSETVLTITTAEGPFKGCSETIQIAVTLIRDGVFLISWQEADKTTVVDVADFENGIVHTIVTESNGVFLRRSGTLKPLQ